MVYSQQCLQYWQLRFSVDKEETVSPVSLLAISTAMRNSLKSRKSLPSLSNIRKMWPVIFDELPRIYKDGFSTVPTEHFLFVS
jgi:hypothetical protein